MKHLAEGHKQESPASPKARLGLRCRRVIPWLKAMNRVMVCAGRCMNLFIAFSEDVVVDLYTYKSLRLPCAYHARACHLVPSGRRDLLRCHQYGVDGRE